MDDIASQRGKPSTRGAELTSREREIAQLIAEGKSTRAIAEQLGLSPKTVETHRANLMTKLKLDSVADLVRWAVRTGLIEV